MKAVIVGGGIGGLTTAIALQSFGIEAEVFETTPEKGEVGAGIWIAANAMAVFEKWGIHKEIQEAGIEYRETLAVGDHTGKILSSTSCQKIYQEFGYYHTAIHRAKLHEILWNHVRNKHLNKTFVRFEEKENVVVAHFQDGTNATGDFLVGADGIKSATRRQLFGETNYRYSGQTCWRFLTSHQPPLEKQQAMMEMWGNQGGLRAAYGKLADDLWYCYVTAPAPQHQQISTEKTKETLQEWCKDFPPFFTEMIQNTPPENFIHNDLYDFAPIHEWFKGKVVLMGDAAHATTPNLGQGACQAIESAYILAKAIHESTSLPEAFSVYQNTRKEKAHFITQQSWSFGQFVNIRSSFGRWMRNLLMRLTPSFVTQKLLKKVYSFSETLKK